MTTPADDRYAASTTLSAHDREAWALAASVAHDGLWFWDLVVNEVALSPRARDMLGGDVAARHRGPSGLAHHVHAADAPAVRDALRALQRGDTARIEVEFRLLMSGGEVRWSLLRARSRRGPDGRVAMVAGALSDVDRRKRAELRLRDEVHGDPLTRLPNRTALTERLTARLARAANAPLPAFAVLYLDLDRFKIINDSLGHLFGDAVLAETAARLATVLGPNDLLARVGGDEFVILLDEIDESDTVARMSAALHAALRPAIRIDGRDVFTTVSVGVRSGVRVSGETLTRGLDLLRDADVAMYHAKARGGGVTIEFDRAMHDAFVEKLRVQTELHGALQRGEFELAYQPIFDAADSRLCGFEALTRWNHPTRGRLAAKDFVNDANESGAIVPIGRWVLGEACSQLADWIAVYPQSFALSVSVNLCDREVLDPDFVAAVQRVLAATNLPHERLVLEMSEGAMVSHASVALPLLRRLRDLGVQIQMDNFGRGYSSLNTLRRMPISAVKIDRSFIAEIDHDEDARAILSTIAGYARALGLDVIAEGVETSAQAAALAAMGGFRYVQGNYFSRPVASPTARGLLDNVDDDNGLARGIRL